LLYALSGFVQNTGQAVTIRDCQKEDLLFLRSACQYAVRTAVCSEHRTKPSTHFDGVEGRGMTRSVVGWGVAASVYELQPVVGWGVAASVYELQPVVSACRMTAE
jgi:hypothetical protein